jgi:uncharacterized OB-fold protein
MSLLHRIQHPRDALTWEGEMPTRGLYTAGLAGARFLREIKEHGRFMATPCRNCGITYLPPRLYCERCFRQLEEWIEVPSTGHVHTFTVLHLDLNGNRLPAPRVIAFVQVDGTDGGLVHYLGGVEPEHVYIGMPVEAVFKAPEERRGSILDIAHFQPAGK